MFAGDDDVTSFKIKKEKLKLHSKGIVVLKRKPDDQTSHKNLNGNLTVLTQASVVKQKGVTTESQLGIAVEALPSKTPTFSPPGHSRSNRTITPSKRVLENIADASDLPASKIRRIESNSLVKPVRSAASPVKSVVLADQGESEVIEQCSTNETDGRSVSGLHCLHIHVPLSQA